MKNIIFLAVTIFLFAVFMISCDGDDSNIKCSSSPTGKGGDMCDVSSAKFQMGCNETVDNKCENNENPFHTVTLLTYKIDKYEVTVGEFQKCVDKGDCNNDKGDELHYSIYSEEDSYCNLGATGKGSHPMNCVSWFGAAAYCEWAGKRLPTEAEWEKAARGTDGRKYPWGNEPEVSCEYGVISTYGKNGEYYRGCNSDSTWIVGSIEKGKSPYGAYDMIGNVWEWTNDWYGETYYETAPSENPLGPESGDGRVLRGGSWGNSAEIDLRSSTRLFDNLLIISPTIGFRCAK